MRTSDTKYSYITVFDCNICVLFTTSTVNQSETRIPENDIRK